MKARTAPADLLIVNGRIATMNKRQPFVSALAIKGDTIVGTGSEADLQHLRGPKTAVIDTGGRAVMHRRARRQHYSVVGNLDDENASETRME